MQKVCIFVVFLCYSTHLKFNQNDTVTSTVQYSDITIFFITFPPFIVCSSNFPQSFMTVSMIYTIDCIIIRFNLTTSASLSASPLSALRYHRLCISSTHHQHLIFFITPSEARRVLHDSTGILLIVNHTTKLCVFHRYLLILKRYRPETIIFEHIILSTSTYTNHHAS